MVYQAASPDEKALAEGAMAYGVQFMTDANEQVKIKFQGNDEVYERLHVLEFDSTRKRMSVIVRDAEGKHFIFSKVRLFVLRVTLKFWCAVCACVRGRTKRVLSEVVTSNPRDTPHFVVMLGFR